MNLNKLFEIQAKLDKHIVEEKGLEGQDLLDKKILALQVELGELANEWRGFKFWSENQIARTHYERICHVCKGKGEITVSIFPDIRREICAYCVGTGLEEKKNPLLEEFVDCLHFILSIGLDIGVKTFKPAKLISFTNDITGQFNAVFKLIGHWDKVVLLIDKESYGVVMNNFLHLGEQLGFTEQQIEQAYLDKNKINFERQQNGY